MQGAQQDVDEGAAGYVTELPYPLQHHPGLDPVLQTAVLAAAGYAAPALTAAFTYVEFGCGPGLSLLAHAAAHPAGRFIGVDVNPAHTTYIQTLADAAGLTNVQAVTASFSELDAAQLPPCDFMAMHGVWSWISVGNRQRLTTLVNQRLKPGGALYVSYNCLPGMAGILPLRTLMLLAPQAGADLAARIRRSVDFAATAGRAGLNFLRDNPVAAERLGAIGTAPLDYLAHEYFNRDWAAFYHHEVAGPFRSIGLSYAASTHASENLEQAHYTPEAQELLAGLTDPLARETLKDFASNRTFRADLYVRAARRLSTPARARQLARVRWAYACRPQDFPAAAPDRYLAVAQALAQAPLSVRELAQAAGGAVGAEELQEIVLMLFAMKIVQPAAPDPMDTRRRAAVARLNAALLALAGNGEAPPGLVSPVTGSIFAMTPVELGLAAGETVQDADALQAAPLLRYLGLLN